MLYLPLSKIADSAETVVANGAAVADEGLALIRATGAPSAGVTVSGGAAGEVFAGFSIAGTAGAALLPTYASKVESFVVPGSTAVTLAFTPVSGQIVVFDVTANAVVAITGGVTLVGKTIAGLTAGNTVRITYHYALSVIQARALVGDANPGGYSGGYVGQVGLIKRGLVYTSAFDASKNWAAATGIKLAASGQLTDQSGSGVAINGYVVAVPNAEVPFLGLEFSAA